ncbi:helix-turn-helix domain-containing protein [Lachnospiraceae bacterium OttesenSCG-928-D06]|nr:helix-turn-helix domain-containing protein [Lachnospiraceae bacterium OttesenSCG-928-D06]
MNELNFKTIGLKIKERRITLGITQSEIAEALDVNPSHISNIETGRAHPSLSALINIANILSCSVDYFISGEYTYKNKSEPNNIDSAILEKIKYFDIDKKQRVLKIIELL